MALFIYTHAVAGRMPTGDPPKSNRIRRNPSLVPPSAGWFRLTRVASVGRVSALPILVPDAGPLITLAYAGRLDLLQRPGWPVQVVDRVLHEVTRNQTPSREMITAFAATQKE